MNGLTEEGERTLSRVGRYLTDSYRYVAESDDPDVREEWEEEKQSILTGEDINWWVEGTRRIIAGFGRTANGRFLATDETPVIGKYEPWAIEMDDVSERSSNYHERTTYRLAIERGDADLFARIVHIGADNHWIAMEECTPVFPSPPMPYDYGQDYLVDKQRMRTFEQKFEDRGWYEHDFKNGNIGVTLDGQTVLLDYGSFTRLQDE